MSIWFCRIDLFVYIIFHFLVVSLLAYYTSKGSLWEIMRLQSSSLPALPAEMQCLCRMILHKMKVY